MAGQPRDCLIGHCRSAGGNECGRRVLGAAGGALGVAGHGVKERKHFWSAVNRKARLMSTGRHD